LKKTLKEHYKIVGKIKIHGSNAEKKSFDQNLKTKDYSLIIFDFTTNLKKKKIFR
jgi:hypothetical protein